MKPEQKTGQRKTAAPGSRPASAAGKRPAARRTPAADGKTPGKKNKRPAASRPAAQTAPAGKKTAARPARNSAVRNRAARTGDRRRRVNSAAGAVHTARQREPLPEVIYLPPKQFNRNRFLLQLVTLVAVVLSITFVFSIFFKVKTVTVAGNVKYDAWTIREASGIQEGEGLLSFGNAKAAGKIKTLLPYVKEVQIGIKLPDTVKIEIVESSVAYSVPAVDGTWWEMSAEGKILGQTDKDGADDVTKIQGLELAAPVGEQAQAYEHVAQNAFGDTIPVSMSATERLDVLLQILQALEMNGVMGEVTLIDVTQPTDLQLWFGEKYQILLGNSTRIAHKIGCVQAVFRQEEYLEAGSIDVSFTDEEHPNDVIFTPFTE